MEIVNKQSRAEDQRRSLIEFMLGDHRGPGWLDVYHDRHGSAADALQRRFLEHAAAA